VAKEASRALIASELGAPVSQVKLSAGAKSRVRQLSVEGDPGVLIARPDLANGARLTG
jgi:uncharacterized protein YggU (UPF0235/DUF167 family)